MIAGSTFRSGIPRGSCILDNQGKGVTVVKKALCILAMLCATPVSSWAAIGETWVLPIHHRDGGGWVEHPGAGYAGTSAWEGSG